MSKKCFGKITGLDVLRHWVCAAASLCFLISCGDDGSSNVDTGYAMRRCEASTEGVVDSLDGVRYVCSAGEWVKLQDSSAAANPATVDSLNQNDPEVHQDTVKASDTVGRDTTTVYTLQESDSSKTVQDTSKKEEKDSVLLENVNVTGSFGYGLFDSRSSVVVEALDESFKFNGTTYPAAVSAKGGTYTAANVSFREPYARASVYGKVTDLVHGGTITLNDTLFALVAANGKNGIANINALTFFKSVYMQGLLTAPESTTVAKASEKASDAVWGMFHFDKSALGPVDTVTSFASGEPGAALLAATIMMQVFTKDTVANLWKVAADFADGSWDDSLARAKIADWAFEVDVEDEFETIHKNVEKLGLAAVPEFEKYIRMFYQAELGIPVCNEENDGKIVSSTNPFSMYYASEYSDVSVTMERFLCDAEEGAWRQALDKEKDTYEFGTGTNGETRQGRINGDAVYKYNEAGGNWRVESSAVARNAYFVDKSDITDFVDLQTVYEGIKADERVIFVLRHGQRDQNATSKEAGLSIAGLDSSKAVGSRLTKFNEPMRLGASEFYRAQQTVIGIALGREQDTTIADTIPELNDDWYMIDRQLVNQAESDAGGGWEATSYYTYTGRYSGDTARIQAYYNLEERSAELIELLYDKYKDEPDRFIMLSSHDKLMVPFVAYCSKLRINMNVTPNAGGTWINYFAGIAIIWDKSGNRRYVAFKGLKDAYFQGW